MSLFKRIKKVLTILPHTLRDTVLNKIEIRKENRFVHGKKMDASYDPETGRILIWGRLNAPDIDLIIILMHEIGHLFFHQILEIPERREWFKIHAEENLDFELKKEYDSVQIPEEVFCCAFSLVGLEIWFEKNHMKDKAAKLKMKFEKEAPKTSTFVRKIFNQQSKDIFHSTVKRIRKWVEEATGPLK